MLAAPLRRLGGAVLDALLPPRCLGCGEPVLRQGTLCAPCFITTPLITPPCCAACGLPFGHESLGEAGEDGEDYCPRCLMLPPLYGQARAAFLYGPGARRLLLPFKHGDRSELAGPIALQMLRAGQALLERAELILPVPLHRWRLLRRRYNQSALLAGELSRLSGRPWAPDLLRRIRRTPPLAEKGAVARQLAVAGAFTLGPGAAGRIAGRRLLLVDDVLTTGATADACALALLQGGAAAVDVLAAARVPDPRLEAR